MSNKPEDFIPDDQFVSDSVTSPLQSGQTPDFIPDDQFKSDEEILEDKYGSPSQQIKAGLEGVAEGIAGPLATATETNLLGIKPEDIRGRRQENPITHGAGQIAGLAGSMASGVGEGALLAKLGSKANLITRGAGEASLARNIAASAVQGAVENMALTTGDEITKRLIDDPHQSLGSAMADVGLSGLLGGGVSGGLGAISPLWKATAGTKLGKYTGDFKARLHERMHNSEPLEALTKELEDFHGNITTGADEVYGPQGLKASATSKAVPEINDKISDQASEIASKMDATLAEMNANQLAYPARLTDKLSKNYQEFANVIKKPDVSSSEVFNALEDLKRNAQAYSKYDKFVKPTDAEYDFVQKAKELAHDLRMKSEDEGVWKGAAKVQKEINEGFKQYIQPLKEFQSKFMEKLNGELVIAPGKVAAFFNKAGKPTGKTQRQVLENFKKASQEYAKAIDKAHLKLGSESPIKPLELYNIDKALEEISPGAKLADVIVDKSLSDLGSKAAGGATGAVVGGMLGHPYIGALIGEHTLASFYKSTLPALIKPMLGKPTSAEGLKAAAEYGAAISKGESKINRAARNIFNVVSNTGHATRSVIAGQYASSDAERKRLDKQLQALQKDPSNLVKTGGAISHYLPDHAPVISETAAHVIQYLQKLRPQQDKQNPLDRDMPISKIKQAEYENALDIAAKPLIVMDKINKGNLTPQDIVALKSMYPGLYQRMSSSIMNEMSDSVNKGKIIPYAKRMSLSMFLGQPLDSTMTPTSIMAAQPISNAAPTPNQQPARAPSASSLKNLSKSPQRYMTAEQQTQARKIRQ